jgi:hypothetical protein
MIDKLINILWIASGIGMLDVCIIPWIGFSIENTKISRIFYIVGIAGAVVITTSMFLGLILTIIKDKINK